MKTTAKKMMMAMIAFVFAATTTSCKKESGIIPSTPTPTVSLKPKSIVTTEDGVAGVFRTQTYEYDSRNHLTKFVSVSATTKDSLIFNSAGIGFLRMVNGTIRSKELLKLNSDKSLRQLVISGNSSTLVLTPLFTDLPGSPNTLTSLSDASNLIEFTYLDKNLRSINVNTESVSYTYYDNIRYQKGINEIQSESTALLYHKIAEQEDMINYSLFSKLIHTVTIKLGNDVKKIVTYNYVLDEQGRVTKIFETIDFISNADPSRQFQHTITY